jgi:predicted phage replisome organizer/uncharacterized phage protein (TIGR02220 family)
MSDVKWIKLKVNMFEIRLIESMPEGDTLLVIWFKLLSQAGRTNAKGYIFLNENIPYTPEMLSTLFNRPLPTVRLALQTFKQFGMIDIDDADFISVNNWEKHQNIDGMEKLKLTNAERQKRYRERQKQAALGIEAPSEDSESNVNSNVTRNVTDNVTSLTNNALDIDKEIDKEKDNIVEIVNYLNSVCSKKFKATTEGQVKFIRARLREGNAVEDLRSVIDKKAAQWLGTAQEKYLRPSTLFNAEKFEAYINESAAPKKAAVTFEDIEKELDLND